MMNNEVKEILVDLIDYYNTIGTEDDPGFKSFTDIVNRSSKMLERNATPRIRDVLPHKDFTEKIIKQENEW